METVRTVVRAVLAVLFLSLSAQPGYSAETRAPAPPPESGAQGRKIVLYLFWGKGCPHCAEEEKFLDVLNRKYPQMEVRALEVWRDRKNAEFFRTVMKAAGAKTAAVPATIVGDRLYFGFNAKIGRSIEDSLARCINEGCPDTESVVSGLAGVNPREEESLSFPLLGKVDPGSVSLPLFTIVIGGLDSFNPCAFFVLLFLLSLLIHVRSRKRMLFIGGTFVLFSGIVYFLFMAAWLNIFLIIGQMTAITLAAGAVSLVIAAINIKDFFMFKQGVSLVIPERAKPKLYERMRGLLRSQSLTALTAGTIVLALMANFYELLCTAGFPMLYTRVLTLQRLTPGQYYLYLALYNVVYVLPLAVIVAVITVTLGARKLTEWQGRRLKLLSGLMMLFLGLLLLIRPELLNNAIAAVVLLAASIAVTAIASLLMKNLRPSTTRE